MSFFHRMAVVLGIVCLLSLSLMAQETVRPSAIEQRIQRIQDHILTSSVIIEGQSESSTLADRMAALRVPGLSIAVIRNGAIEWARGFGVTRIGGPPVTPETLFQAASISKPVSALGVLRLVESGKLKLDTDVNQYLQTWKIPENDFTSKAKVTLRGLLTHTAGMTVDGFPGYASDARIPTVAQILMGQPPANSPGIFVDTTPGTLGRYSGGGYLVVQLLLGDVTGTPFAQLMQSSVLTPLGMTHSTFEQPLPAARMANVAMPYEPQGQPVPGGPHVYPELAAAGLWTTPSDLARYALEVQRALAGKSAVLSAAMAREMLTPGMNGHGLGPGTGGSKKHPYFGHSGGNAGYRCYFVAYNKGDGAVVMTNSDNGDALGADILRTLAFEYKWPDFQPVLRKITRVDSKRLDTYVGAYQMPNFVVTITRDGDRLFAQPAGQERAELFPTAPREFFVRDVNVLLTFETGAKGKITRLVALQDGQKTTGPRLADAGGKVENGGFRMQ